MKKLLWLALVLVAGYFGYRHFNSPAKPGSSEVEAELKDFLANGKGHCNVTHLADVSVGDFSDQFGGWPIYASHEVTCQEGNTSTTYDGRDDAQRKVAAAFARRNGAGNLELFVPQFFQDAQRQLSQDMQQQLQQAVDQAKPQ